MNRFFLAILLLLVAVAGPIGRAGAAVADFGRCVAAPAEGATALREVSPCRGAVADSVRGSVAAVPDALPAYSDPEVAWNGGPERGRPRIRAPATEVGLYGMATGDDAMVEEAYGFLEGKKGEVANAALNTGISAAAAAIPGVNTTATRAAVNAAREVVSHIPTCAIRKTTGCAANRGLSEADRVRIQNFADKHDTEVHVVGSRADGAKPADYDFTNSDYDYIVGEGGTSKLRQQARRELPCGKAGGEIHPSRGETGIDVFREPLDPSRPHTTFKPGKKQ